MSEHATHFLPTYTGTEYPGLPSVICTRSQDLVPVDRCVQCEHGTRLTTDIREETWLRCTWPAGQSTSGHAMGDSVEDAPRSEPEVDGRVVRHIMTVSIFTVAGDVSVDTVRRLLVHRVIGGLPVVNGHRRPIGIVSKADLDRHGDTSSPTRRVRDVMSPFPFTVSANAAVPRAIPLVAMEPVDHLAVVDPDSGVLLALLTPLDVAGWLAGGMEAV